MHAGDVPAAPAGIQRRSSVTSPGLVRHELAAGAGIARADDETGHAVAQERVRIVAAQAARELVLELGAAAAEGCGARGRNPGCSAC